MLRFFRTIRWLRPGQITGRLTKYLFRPVFSPSPAASEREADGRWESIYLKPPAGLAEGEPVFLNRKGRLSKIDDWNSIEQSRLWIYNLHYFDDLNAFGADERQDENQQIVQRWIDGNPPTAGAGWEPYPTSLRIVNWIKWILAGGKTNESMLISLSDQAGWLAKNIEKHLLGNHLFANAKALVFAGALLSSDDSDDWLNTGLTLLDREIAEQILPDGGQFELSPMYQSIAIMDMLDLVNLSRAFPNAIPQEAEQHWCKVLGKMMAWLRRLIHPDGEIALLNDSAFGVAPTPAQLFTYAERLGIPHDEAVGKLSYLDSSGYVRAENESCVLIADVAQIGPDYLPGHAHADTFTFELSLFGRRWIVDTGCSVYEACTERLRQRGTSAHNTVVVNDADSSEVWSSFRVARRAKPFDVSAHLNGDSVIITGRHDGYRRFGTPVIHERRFELSTGRLLISDKLLGDCESKVANFLLHPDVRIDQCDDALELSGPGGTMSMSFSGGVYSVTDSTWHPEFGKSVSCKRVSVAIVGPELDTQLVWAIPVP